MRVYVLGDMVFRGELVNQGQTAESDLLLVVLGQSTIFLETAFSGFLIAPSATVQVRNTPTPHDGTIFAKRIVLDGAARFRHRRFDFNEFFPPTLIAGPRPFPPYDPGPGPHGPDDFGDDLGLPPGQRACEPGLELVSELEGIQPRTELAIRVEPKVPGACIAAFQACDENEQPLSSQPDEAALNAPPSLDSTCGGLTETVYCGVDPETVVWDDVGLCSSDADCILFGRICARVCMKPDCTGDVKECLDPTCAEPEYRCAARTTVCHAQATTGPCEEVRECAEDDASGSSDPGDHQVTGQPPSNLDDPPAATPPPSEEVPNRPTTYGDEKSVCGITVDSVDVELDAEEDERDIVAGNDKWGIIVKPRMDFIATADPKAIGGQAAITVESTAGLSVAARLWAEDYPVFIAQGSAEFGTCKGQLSRTLVLFGTDIDPGPGDDVPSNDQDDTCSVNLGNINNRFARMYAAQARALDVKRFADCLGPRDTDNAAAWDDFCDEALDRRPADLDGFDGFLEDCSLPTAGPEVADAWLDFYEHLRDREVADLAELATIREQVRGNVPNGPLGFLDIDQSVTWGPPAFTYPVGPVTVSIQFELVGGWGMSGDLSYGYETPPNARVEAQASIRPRFSAGVVVFAGIGIGPVVVGVEGTLILLNVQTPLHAGVRLRQNAVPDERPTFYPAGVPYAFSSAAVTNPPAGYLPFGPTLYDWEAEWSYGAGAYLETLSGQIDLAAKIKLGFFSKSFKKKLAQWDAAFKDSIAFTGTMQASGDLAVLSPLKDAPFLGTFAETIPFADPAWVKTNIFQPRAQDPGSCGTPNLSPCIIVR